MTNEWKDFLLSKMDQVDEGTKNWIQKAVDPDHAGFCTPMTKKTCTPRRKALAKRFKKGDIHADNEKKDKKHKKSKD